MTHHNTYTEPEIDAIARQLETITVNGKRVLMVIKSTAVAAPYHTIHIDTGVEIYTLEFRKAKEETRV